MSDPLLEGVYFGLPADVYHNDPALGSSDIRYLYSDPPAYWWQSPHNPLKPETDSKDLAFGRAFHVRLLEGADAFDKQYLLQPEKDDFPGLLDTMADFKQWLGKRGHTPGGKKLDARHLVRAMNKDVPIWDEIMETFNARLEAEKLEPISKLDLERISVVSDFMRENPNIDDLFGDGASEVTVIWNMYGVRLKARIDLLRIRPLIDLKTIREGARYRRFDQSVFIQMRYDRHDIQAVHLLKARHALALHIAAGAVFEHEDAPVPSRKWLNAVAQESEYSAVFVYVQKTGAPVARPYQFIEGQGPLTLAEDNWQTGVSEFIQWSNRFGLDKPWINYSGVHRVLMDEIHKS